MLSRVADGAYWMSRYLERAEHTARLGDVCLGLTLDRSSDTVRRLMGAVGRRQRATEFRWRAWRRRHQK